MAANIASSDFDISELRDGHLSLYLVVQPAHKKRLRALTRLLLTQIILALMDTHDHVKEPRVLIMLEEVAEIGALDIVATALGLGRGYGLKLYLIAQDLSQLETAWGSKSKTLVANCAIRVASAPNDVATAELLSKMCGTMTVRHTVRNYSGQPHERAAAAYDDYRTRHAAPAADARRSHAPSRAAKGRYGRNHYGGESPRLRIRTCADLWRAAPLLSRSHVHASCIDSAAGRAPCLSNYR